MPPDTFTPKEVAQALGVSESSVKRWVDSGRLHAAKTAGGHRKVPLTSVADFIRRTGQVIADPAVIGMVATSNKATLEEARPELLKNLIDGNESSVRELVLGFYQRGESVAEIGDRLIGPAFTQVGVDWESGELQVHQERRACEIMMATFHELRRWLVAANADGPVALVATPHNDFAEVPARLVELVLLSVGWRVAMAGSGLPLAEVRDAAQRENARLVCLSVTHLENPDGFAEVFEHSLAGPLRKSLPLVSFAIGGSGLRCDAAERLDADLIADDLASLVSFQARLKEER